MSTPVPTRPVATALDAIVRDCVLSSWSGHDGRCRWCDQALHSYRKRWCSPVCEREYARNHMWATARVAALVRDSGICIDCGSLATDVHHADLVRGDYSPGCSHHLDGLASLCPPCHRSRHQPEPGLAFLCRLREIRGDRPLTEMARLSGIHKGTLSMIERGKLLPTDKDVPAIEHAYGAAVATWYPAEVLLVIHFDEAVA